MRLSVLILLFLFLISTLADSQKISFGIKPGLVILDAKYAEIPEVIGLKTDKRVSYAIGLSTQMKLKRFLGLEVEPKFIEKGYNIKWARDDDDIYKNGYLSLTTILRIKPVNKFNIEFGPEISYLLYSKWKNYKGPLMDNSSDNQLSLELSLLAGISYQIHKRMELGIRFSHALTPYEAGTISGQSSEYKIYHKYLEVNLNVLIIRK